MARLFSIKPSLTFKGRKFKGLRGFAGKPLHPPLTDVPAAAYVLVAVFDLISYLAWEGGWGQSFGGGLYGEEGSSIGHDFFVTGTHVIIAGAIVSLGAAVTGFWDWWKGMERDPDGFLGKAKKTQAWRTANWHMTIMLTVTVIVIINIILRLSYWEEGYAEPSIVILSLLAALGVSFGALYGGALVYEMGFNVETAGDAPYWHESEEDVYPGREPPPSA
jgi:uncharacterized membrane protein